MEKRTENKKRKSILTAFPIYDLNGKVVKYGARTASGHFYELGSRHFCQELDCPARIGDKEKDE